MPKLYAGYKQIYTTRFVNTFLYIAICYNIKTYRLRFTKKKKCSLLNKCVTNKGSIEISSRTVRTRWTTVPERGIRQIVYADDQPNIIYRVRLQRPSSSL